jgi:phage replication O-like protein O
MANPQKEDGFVPLANEILEALARTRILSEARQVFDAVIRMTYGWNRKHYRITYRQFSSLTGLTQAHVYRSIQYLIRHRLIEKTDMGYGIQKDHEQWISHSKKWRHLGPEYSVPGYSLNGVAPSVRGVEPTPSTEYPLTPGSEQGTGQKFNEINRLPGTKNNSKDIDKDISLRERLLEELKKQLKGPFILPQGVTLERLDYFLDQIEKGRIVVSKIKNPAAYLKALEITEPFIPYLEREAKEEDRRKKEREFQQELARSEKEFDPETGRRMVRRIIDHLGRKAP